MMPSANVKFTSNKAIDHFTADVPLMKIVAYVEAIEGLRELTKSNSKWIYKCIVNNNSGRKVRVIFWGDDALKYNKEIKMYQILKITGGVIKTANKAFRKSGDETSENEFQFGRASTLEVLGTFEPKGADKFGSAEPVYAPIEMKDVCSACGPVQVTGWVKEHFRSITTAYGTSYGCGMICTDVHRITVHVSSFVPKSDLSEGIKVLVRGRIERRGDAFAIICTNMDDVTIIPGAVAMTEDEMDEAVVGPPLNFKKEVVDSPIEPNGKKMKLA